MKVKMKSAWFSLLVLGMSCGIASAQSRWSEEKANAWYQDHRWLVGCNFSPSFKFLRGSATMQIAFSFLYFRKLQRWKRWRIVGSQH